MNFKDTKKNNGFALLFSVLLASLLLTIGLSIFSVTLKELAISTTAQRSLHAIYAAESGRECAKYWDAWDRIPNVLSTSTVTINCGGVPMIITGVYSDPNGLIDPNEYIIYDAVSSTIPPPGSGKILVNKGGTDDSNFTVTISKTINRGDHGVGGVVLTTIHSLGYDSTGQDRVERAIEQIY